MHVKIPLDTRSYQYPMGFSFTFPLVLWRPGKIFLLLLAVGKFRQVESGKIATRGAGKFRQFWVSQKAYEYDAASELPNTLVRVMRYAMGSRSLQVVVFLPIYL